MEPECTHDGEVELYTVEVGKKMTYTATCGTCHTEIQRTVFDATEQPAAGDEVRG